jgi:BRCT domain type II-containing protein
MIKHIKRLFGLNNKTPVAEEVSTVTTTPFPVVEEVKATVKKPTVKKATTRPAEAVAKSATAKKATTKKTTAKKSTSK